VSPVPSARIRHFPKRLAIATILTVTVAVFISSAWDYAVLPYRAADNPASDRLRLQAMTRSRSKMARRSFTSILRKRKPLVSSLFPRADVSRIGIYSAISSSVRISNYLVKFLYNGNSRVLNSLRAGIARPS